MWSAHHTLLQGRASTQVKLSFSGSWLSFDEVIELWLDSVSFRSFFIELLAGVSYKAYFWETPALTQQTLSHYFEFVLTDAPALESCKPDSNAFRQQFADSDGFVSEFHNLGADAYLIAPVPNDTAWGYAHLANFSRDAPVSLQHALWQRVGRRLRTANYDEPVWVSTSGTGVAWLHIRFDTRPKYYIHEPYRRLRLSP